MSSKKRSETRTTFSYKLHTCQIVTRMLAGTDTLFGGKVVEIDVRRLKMQSPVVIGVPVAKFAKRIQSNRQASQARF